MRRLAPILTFTIVVAALYWVFGARDERRQVVSPGSPAQALGDASRPAKTASRPESAPVVLPLPSAESEPESRAESAPATQPVVVIEVVREDGRPIPYASLHAEGNDVALNGVTNLEGRVETEAHPGITAWVELTGSFHTTRREVSFDSGVRRIIVPTRAMVAGRVVVSGGPPDDVLRLWLTLENDEFLETWTDANGRFEFFNLPPTWHGDLEIPDSHVLEGSGNPDVNDADPSTGSPRTLHLQGPNAALEIRLVALPAIKGCLVRAVTKEPVSGRVRNAVPRSFHQEDFDRTRGDGHFRMRVGADEPAISLTVTDDHGLGARTLTLNGPFQGVRDLGAVELGPTRNIPFRVRDAAGAPVSGAVAEISESWSASDATNDEGRSTIHANAEGGEMRIAKLGWRTATVALPADLPMPLDVVLEAGNQLVIDVRLANGSAPPPGLVYVRLSSPDPMFAGDQDRPDALLEVIGATVASKPELTTHQVLNDPVPVPQRDLAFYPSTSGQVVVGGFRPGAQVAIKLVARALGETLDESFVVMDAAGTKKITLRTQVMPRTFAGLVRSVGGSPIPNAEWWITSAEDMDRSGTVNAEGRFAIGGVFADSIHLLRLTAEGFVTATHRDVPVPALGAERQFTMIGAHEVTIRLVDEDGRPLRENAEVAVHVPGGDDDDRPAIEEPELGTFLAKGLPPGAIEISATVGVAHAGIQHDSRIPLARIVIPSVGGAEVHWTRAATDPAHCRVHIESVPRGIEAFVDVPAEVTDHYLEGTLRPGIYWARVEGLDETDDHWVELGSSGVFRIRLREGIRVEVTR